MSDKIGEILVAKKVITLSDLNEAMRRKQSEPKKYLGQILCEMGLPQSKIVKAIYYSNKRKQLGQVLVDLNVITQEQLQNCLAKQKEQKNKGKHTPLGTLLTNNRIISEINYMDALSAHFSMPIVSLKGYRALPALQKVIGEQYAMQNRLVVMSNSRSKVTVATAEPDPFVFEKLEKALTEGKNILFCLAKSSEIELCLDAVYDPYKGSGFRL